MAVLPDVDRAALWAEYMRHQSAEHATMAFTKDDLRAAVNAADAWVDANAASYNAALPLPARTALTAKQKALLLMFVIRRRWEVG